ncbi:MAG: hypothetical protein PHO07_10600 [Pirellulales bacterium]|jgi:hypothetical protein|nr:hypothetical protein [Thermoguttaceae bacterium]MDD4787614.1 hypothetical protein [Pirellulales bacterium]MDI9444678.1 hypothetical protein [Planctomycetota bacterium]NLZ02310.1 hypothetical protein [Pirellulaceae bacterium]
MKCPRCWAEKAYLHRNLNWRETLLACLAFRPMKCHHCYHRFMVHWLLTLGKQARPPVIRVTPHLRSAVHAGPGRMTPPRRVGSEACRS